MDAQLIAAIEQLESAAEDLGQSEERQTAIDYYYGRKFGNEVDGRSQVVSRDVQDTIEWIKPGLLKVFAGGDEVIRFEPQGPEDVQAAEQETDYLNFVVTQHNNAFLLYNCWMQDALVGRVGYVKAYWNDKKDITKERYEGLSDDEYRFIQADPTATIVEQTQRMEMMAGPDGMPVAEVLWDCVVSREKEIGRVRVENIPPENVRIASSHNSILLQDARFVEHFEFKTISDLRLEGFDVADDIASEDEKETETYNRSITNRSVGEDDTANDPSLRVVKVREVWIRFDYDEDGIAELRHVILVGQNILENEETDLIPIAAITPTIIPHEHVGLSVADAVMDLQLIKSTLMRGFLDNLYLQNNGRFGVNSDIVNLDDMLVSRPGGLVRVKGDPSQAIMPLLQPANGAPVLQGIEYIDTIRENRTGVTKYNQGLDSNSLNKTAAGISQIMTAAQQRIELIARTFAETGIRDLFMIVHALVRKHQTKQDIVRLKGEWVPVDPRNWVKRYDMTVSVGLGTGNRDQILAHLMMILQNQMQAALPIGAARPVNIYNTLARISQNAGFKATDEFWTNPEKNPPQPPPPDPKMVAAQAKAAADQAKLEMEGQKMQMDMQAKERDAQLAEDRAALELQIMMEKGRQEMQLEREKMMNEIRLEQQRLIAEIELKRQEVAAQMTVKREIAQAQIDRNPQA